MTLSAMWRISHYSLSQRVTLVAFSAVRKIPAFEDPVLLVSEGAHE